MADELELLTINAAGDGWIDTVPGAVSTGYQAQNTNIDASRRGLDSCVVGYDSGADEVILYAGGVVDVAGEPFKVSAETRFSLPAGEDDYYLSVSAGSGDTVRTVSLGTTAGSFDTTYFGFYDGTSRVLDSYVRRDSGGVAVYRRVNTSDSGDGMDLETGRDVRAGVDVITEGLVFRGQRFRFWPMEPWGDSFSSPATNPQGLAYDVDNGNLISCDIDSDTIYIHDSVSATTLSSFSSPATNPQGLAYDVDNGNLISCDNGTTTIYIHDGVSGTTLSSFSSPATNPQGLAYDVDNGNLISCDVGIDTIYIHDGVSATTLASFPAPATNPQDLAYDVDNGNLISCDRDTTTIYIHDGVSASILSSFSSPETAPTGLTYDSDNGNLISCDEGTDTIYVHASQLVSA